MSIGRGGPANLIDRGDVYYVDLNPVAGSEQAGRRPAVVVSPRFMNGTNTVVVIPLTTTIPAGQLPPYKVLLRAGSGLREDSVALCHQIRAVDKTRLDARREAQLTEAQLQELDAALQHTLGLE